jgi:hypothetical protein
LLVDIGSRRIMGSLDHLVPRQADGTAIADGLPLPSGGRDDETTRRRDDETTRRRDDETTRRRDDEMRLTPGFQRTGGEASRRPQQ